MVKNINELLHLLKERDHCSLVEAKIMVHDCLEALEDCIFLGHSIDEASDIIQDYLGLEPDYLEILLNEIYHPTYI